MATRNASSSIATMLGENIEAARKAAGLTQGALATAVGVSSLMVVSNWERGVNSPSHENLVSLTRVLKRDLAWFYTDHDQPTDPPAKAAA